MVIFCKSRKLFRVWPSMIKANDKEMEIRVLGLKVEVDAQNP